jgi:hypothetical protein
MQQSEPARLVEGRVHFWYRWEYLPPIPDEAGDAKSDPQRQLADEGAQREWESDWIDLGGEG